jgi:hypothetical protein
MVHAAVKCNPMGGTFELPQHSVDPKTFRLFQYLGSPASRSALRAMLLDRSSQSVPPSAPIDVCALRLYSYPAEDLRCLGPSALHRLLSSPPLSVESEDPLWQMLIDRF